jgi:hypothetical protein
VNFCPALPVTRAWMAVLLLRARRGADYTPPACTGVFDDVACPGVVTDWIEALDTQGITAGCQAEPHLFCPDTPVKRGQVAVFLTRAFGLE